jgi:hypothetical protein
MNRGWKRALKYIILDAPVASPNRVSVPSFKVMMDRTTGKRLSLAKRSPDL